MSRRSESNSDLNVIVSTRIERLRHDLRHNARINLAALARGCTRLHAVADFHTIKYRTLDALSDAHRAVRSIVDLLETRPKRPRPGHGAAIPSTYVCARARARQQSSCFDLIETRR